jgi:hypothetical protein
MDQALAFHVRRRCRRAGRHRHSRMGKPGVRPGEHGAFLVLYSLYALFPSKDNPDPEGFISIRPPRVTPRSLEQVPLVFSGRVALARPITAT